MHRRVACLFVVLMVVLSACWFGPAASSPPAGGSGSVVPASVPTAVATPSASAWASWSPAPTGAATPTAGHGETRTAAPTTTARPPASHAPTARPTGNATPRPTATPHPPVTSVVVRRGPRASGAVALTFDMGGRVGDALKIVDWLIAHQVHATIFMTGSMADNPNTDAGRQVLARIDAHPELFSLGNHSYNHPDFRTLTAAQMRSELSRTEDAIDPWCSQDPTPFFRPPYGGSDAETLATVGAVGYRWTVLWEIDTIDWRPIDNDPPGPTAEQMVDKVLDNAQGGSIVLMHLGGYETYEALPTMVAGLQAAGFALESLDELLGG